MSAPKILVIPGSSREGSVNVRLAEVIAKALAAGGADASSISLADYNLPIYNGDDEATAGIPQSVISLAALIEGHQGIVIVSPEYNGSLSPLLKNALDWLSRDMGELKPYQNRTFALAGCSPGGLGGIRGLSHLRDILTSVGADTIAPQLAVGAAGNAFTENHTLANERAASLLQNLCDTLIERSKHLI